MPTPYTGPALAPQRTATLGPEGVVLGPPGAGPQFTPGQGSNAGLGPHVMQSADPYDVTTAPKQAASPAPANPPSMTYQTQPSDVQGVGAVPQAAPPAVTVPEFLTSPPPAQPDFAAEVQALRQQNGELISRLGTLEAGYRKGLEQMQLRMEVGNIPSGYQIPPATLPAGIDPDANVTAKDFFQGVYSMLPALSGEAASQAIRASWDISPQEEQLVLSEIPEISQKPEPVRTQLIMKAVRMNRSYASPAGSNGSAPVQAAPAPRLTRPVGHVVPHVESAQAPMAPEPVGQDRNGLLQQARTDYERARLMPTRTVQEARSREEALRTAWRKIETLGAGDGIPRDSSFRQTV